MHLKQLPELIEKDFWGEGEETLPQIFVYDNFAV